MGNHASIMKTWRIYLPGLGDEGHLSTLRDFEETADRPFVMAAPIRSKEKWWFISNGKEWGWVDGDFDKEEVALIAAWIHSFSREPFIDKDFVSI